MKTSFSPDNLGPKINLALDKKMRCWESKEVPGSKVDGQKNSPKQ
jgi:hypothetical protein